MSIRSTLYSVLSVAIHMLSSALTVCVFLYKISICMMSYTVLQSLPVIFAPLLDV